MGLIFWVDEDKFVADLVGKVFQKKNLEFYHLEDLEEFSFRTEDLNPVLIVLDAQTVRAQADLLRGQFESTPSLRDFSYVIKGADLDLDFITNVRGNLSLPLNPFHVPEQLESALSNSGH